MKKSMSSLISKLAPTKDAVKELKQFTQLSVASSLVGLVVFPALGIVGAGAGLRALLLTFHNDNKSTAKLLWYRMALLCSLAVAALDIYYMLSKT